VRGFTLLEMLVVLVLLGMAASIVAPPLARTVDRVRESGDREDVRRGLEGLPVAARGQGAALAFGAGVAIVPPGRAWPEGWRVVAATPVRIESTGWCRGGEVQVNGPAGPHRWRLASPDCRVEDVDAP
jgi:prepilin-type N-terminal cleavage/methylation domain-containing protein